MTRPRALAAAGLLAAGLTSSFSQPAAAEMTITAQAVAAHGEFLTQAPPPPTPGVLCLVDSGVDVNPDTEGLLTARESIFGGTLDDVTTYHHGTYIAMVAGAPANGWGMVGAWPQLKVHSVRVLPEGSEHLTGAAYRDGIGQCLEAKFVQGIDVRVIELAIGGPSRGRTTVELDLMRLAIDSATNNGILVVSAAGNDGGAVNAPASVPGALAVGAADAGGGWCDFSSRGPEIGIVALGCGMDVALASGEPGSGQSTSLASAYVAGVATALRSYRPDLNVTDTRRLLIETATPTAAGAMLNATAVFRAAGLGALVDAYIPPAPQPAPGSPTPCDTRARICAQPAVRSIKRRGRRITIRLKSVPRGARAIVRVNGKVRLRSRSKTLTVRVRRFRTISIRFTRRGLASSAPTVIRPTMIKP